MKEKLIQYFKTSQRNGKNTNGKIIAIIIFSNIFCYLLFSISDQEMAPKYIYKSQLSDSISINRRVDLSIGLPEKLPVLIAISLGNKYVKAYLHEVSSTDSEQISALLEIRTSDLRIVLNTPRETLEIVPYHAELFQAQKRENYEISF